MAKGKAAKVTAYHKGGQIIQEKAELQVQKACTEYVIGDI
jgi:hypothetical protein